MDGNGQKPAKMTGESKLSEEESVHVGEQIRISPAVSGISRG